MHILLIECIFLVNKEKDTSEKETSLRESIGKHPELFCEFNSWLHTRRIIDPAIFIGESLSNLENIVFKDKIFLTSVFAGAAGTIADDLIDKYAFEDMNQV